MILIFMIQLLVFQVSINCFIMSNTIVRMVNLKLSIIDISSVDNIPTHNAVTYLHYHTPSFVPMGLVPHKVDILFAIEKEITQTIEYGLPLIYLPALRGNADDFLSHHLLPSL